jgi:hypothetical protein
MTDLGKKLHAQVLRDAVEAGMGQSGATLVNGG